MNARSREPLVEIELILGEEGMQLVERAAAICGQSVDVFVLATALERSEEVFRARKQSRRRNRRAQGGSQVST